jgi:hypothetical protein
VDPSDDDRLRIVFSNDFLDDFVIDDEFMIDDENNFDADDLFLEDDLSY